MNCSSIKHDVVPLFSNCETLQNFINEHPIDLENVKRNKKRKMEKLHNIKLAQTRCKISPCQKLTTCSKLVVFFYVKN
jgi:hypothetical protein